MAKTILILITSLLLSFTAIAETAKPPKIEEGVQYFALQKSIAPEKEVIEFFSFNCANCYVLELNFKLIDSIKNNLPKNVKFKKYSLNDFGPLAQELSQAWAIANILGISDKVSEELYNGIHRDKTIKNENDIKNVFANLGVDNEKYENMKKDFLVKAFIIQQEQAKNKLKPAYIPTFYINGKYFINPKGLDTSSKDAAIQDYSRVINYLSLLKK